MKTPHSWLTGIVLFALLCGPALAAQAKPKLSMDEAKKIATKRVEGTVRSSKFEHEMGQDVYSFDILGNDQKIHEILVNANSGKIVSQKIESAAQEAAEKQAENQSSQPQH